MCLCNTTRQPGSSGVIGSRSVTQGDQPSSVPSEDGRPKGNACQVCTLQRSKITGKKDYCLRTDVHTNLQTDRQKAALETICP